MSWQKLSEITVKANNLYITYVGRTTENRFSAQETTATNTTITTTPTSYQQPIYKIIVSNGIVYKLSTYHYIYFFLQITFFSFLDYELTN